MPRLKRTIFSKALVHMIIIAFVAGGLILAVAIREQTRNLEEGIFEKNVVLARMAAQAIENGYLTEQWPFELLDQISESEGFIFLWVVSLDGEIYLADNPNMWGKKIKDPDLGGKEPIVKKSIFKINDKNEEIELIIYPIFSGTKGSLFLGVSLRPVVAARNEMIFTSLISFTAVIVFAIFLALYFARKLTHPLIELTKGAESIAAGNLSQRVDLKTGDEAEELANTFNQMAEKLQKQIEELKELDRMKSEFLSITSHELRTPITPIKAQLELLLGKYFGQINKKQEYSLKMILRNARRLDLLISDILEVSRLGVKRIKLDLKSIQLNVLILNTIENMGSLIHKKQLKVSTKLTRLPKIMIDRERIGEVITNLLENAIKFTPNKGKIMVGTEKKKNNIIIKISDTGIGIAKENLKKIFEPFVQLEPSATRKYGGTGLGLSICKGIVGLHNGKIWAESTLGKGSTFYFSLPIKKKFK